jgi:GBP family porin
MYGFSNEAGGFADNRAYSVGASYNYGPLNIAAAYLQLNNDVNQAVPNALGAVSGDNPLAAGRQRTFGGGLSYAFGPATVGFVFTQTMLDNALGVTAAGTGGAAIPFSESHARFTNYEVNGRYSLTPALSVAGAYTYTDSRISGESPKFHQVSLQTAYALSKRTDVYLQGEYQHVTDTEGTNLGATITGVGVSSTENQVSATVGIRHRF